MALRAHRLINAIKRQILAVHIFARVIQATFGSRQRQRVAVKTFSKLNYFYLSHSLSIYLIVYNLSLR